MGSDNDDRFVYNLGQYIGELGAEPLVHRHDELSVQQIIALRPDAVLISPGPGTPDDAGVSNEVITTLGGEVPILGVCLGHQCIGPVYGGEVVRARSEVSSVGEGCGRKCRSRGSSDHLKKK